MRAELFTARALGEQLLALAEAERDPTLYLEAHYALAATLSCIGDFSDACDHAEQAIALYDPESHCSHALFYGQDPGVFSLLWASMDLWFLGYPDRALKRSQNMLILAHEAAHPFSLTIALFMAAVLQVAARTSDRPTAHSHRHRGSKRTGVSVCLGVGGYSPGLGLDLSGRQGGCRPDV